MWIRKYEAGQLTDEVVDAVRIAEYEGKIAELERKVGQLTMEIDLLKKGAQLARRPSGDNYSIVSGPKVSPPREDAEPLSWRVRLDYYRSRRCGGENYRARSNRGVCATNFHATAIAG